MKTIIKKEIKQFKEFIKSILINDFYYIDSEYTHADRSKGSFTNKLLSIPDKLFIEKNYNYILNYNELFYNICNNHIILNKNIRNLEEQGIMRHELDYVYPEYKYKFNSKNISVYGVLKSVEDKIIYCYVNNFDNALSLFNLIKQDYTKIEWYQNDFILNIILLETNSHDEENTEDITKIHNNHLVDEWMLGYKIPQKYVNYLKNKKNQEEINEINSNNYNIKIYFYNDFAKKVLSPSDYQYLLKLLTETQEFLNKLFSGKSDKEIDRSLVNSFEENLYLIMFNQVFPECDFFDKDSLEKNETYQKLLENGLDSDVIFERILNSQSNWYKLIEDSINEDNYNWIKSIFTSEWMFQQFEFFPMLDNTIIIACFLKSIEQLLYYCFLKYHRELLGDNLYLKNKLMLRYEYNIIQDSNNIIINEGKNLFLEKLDEFIRKDRNGFFHKDSITISDLVHTIRQDTYQILLMILILFESINN